MWSNAAGLCWDSLCLCRQLEGKWEAWSSVFMHLWGLAGCCLVHQGGSLGILDKVPSRGGHGVPERAVGEAAKFWRAGVKARTLPCLHILLVTVTPKLSWIPGKGERSTLWWEECNILWAFLQSPVSDISRKSKIIWMARHHVTSSGNSNTDRAWEISISFRLLSASRHS